MLKRVRVALVLVAVFTPGLLGAQLDFDPKILIGEWWGEVFPGNPRSLYFLTIKRLDGSQVYIDFRLPTATRGPTSESFVGTLTGRTLTYESPRGRAAALTLSGDGETLSGPFNNGPDVRGILELRKTSVITPPAVSEQTPPLPANMRIVSPASETPPQVAAFSGKWVGVWGGHLDHVLVVERIDGRTAYCIYSWGVAPLEGVKEPGYRRFIGQIGADGLLRLSLPSGGFSAEVSYELSKDRKTLKGIYTRPRVMGDPRFLDTHGLFKKWD